LKLRKLIPIFLAGLVISTLIFSAQAQAWEIELGPNLYYFDPEDDVFREFYGAGLSYGLDSRLWFENGFGLGSEALYFTRNRYYAGDDFRVQAYSWQGAFNYSLKGNPRLRPYFGVGLAVNYVLEQNLSGKDTVANTTFGYLAGAGLEFKLKYIQPYVQITYRDIPAEEQELDLTGWMTGAGIQIPIPLKKKPPASAPGLEH